MFLREDSYAHQDYIYLIKNTVKSVIFDVLLPFNKAAFYLNIL